jgi:hypothetical protein
MRGHMNVKFVLDQLNVSSLVGNCSFLGVSSVTFVQIWHQCSYRYLNSNYKRVLNIVVKNLNLVSLILLLLDSCVISTFL